MVDTLIKHYILLEETLNTKIDKAIYLNHVFLFTVFSFDLKLVCKVCKFLSEK